MAAEFFPFENAHLEDAEVQSQNCCLSIVSSRSSKNVGSLKTPSFHILKPSQKSKSSKQLKNKSLNFTLNSLNIPSHANIAPSGVHQEKLKIHKITSIATNSSAQGSPDKRALIVKKCLDYKNKKILEHSQAQQKSPESMILLTPKKQTSISTSRNTPRNEFLNQSSLLKLSKFEDEDDFLRENQSLIEVPSYGKKPSSVYLKVSKSKKTLENLYEQQSGRKIQIVESQASQADLYSVVEDHDWHLNF